MNEQPASMGHGNMPSTWRIKKGVSLYTSPLISLGRALQREVKSSHGVLCLLCGQKPRPTKRRGNSVAADRLQKAPLDQHPQRQRCGKDSLRVSAYSRASSRQRAGTMSLLGLVQEALAV